MQPQDESRPRRLERLSTCTLADARTGHLAADDQWRACHSRAGTILRMQGLRTAQRHEAVAKLDACNRRAYLSICLVEQETTLLASNRLHDASWCSSAPAIFVDEAPAQTSAPMKIVICDLLKCGRGVCRLA